MTSISPPGVTVAQLHAQLAEAQAQIAALTSENRRLAADLDTALDLAAPYALAARQERCVSTTAFRWRPEISQPLEMEM